MSTSELIVLPLYLLFFYWIISSVISMYRNDKELEKHFGKNFNKPIKNKVVMIQQKICTQTQPFVINEKESIVCNFPCDGNCNLINK